MESFNHPYKPYETQLKLMNSIYTDLLSANNEHSTKLALYESPTGTGKTLSIICPVMTYLRDVKLSKITQSKDATDVHHDNDSFSFSDADDPDWITSSYEQNISNQALKPFEEFEESIDKFVLNGDVRSLDEQQVKRRRLGGENKSTTSTKVVKDDDDELIITTDTIEDEIASLLKRIKSSNHDGRNLSKESIPNLRQPIRIIFTSRTHSQLQQFSQQLKKVKLHSSFKNFKFSHKSILSERERVKLLPVGSKRQLCCNDRINTNTLTVEQINDKCQDLRKDNNCLYFKNLKDSSTNSITNFPTPELYKTIIDIEDLHEIGKQSKKCPYYGTKPLLETAEIITMPYQLLFMNDNTIDLANSIVIVDEAHNLVNTLIDMNRVDISLKELISIQKGIKIYMEKFEKKLAQRNMHQLNKVKNVVTDLIHYFEEEYVDKKTTNLLPFLRLNANEMIKFMETSYFPQKLQSYMIKNELVTSKTPLLFKLIKFLSILTNNKTTDGVWYFENNALKYLPYSPGINVSSVIESCSKMVLIGGTMQPFDQFDILFHNNQKTRDIFENQSIKIELGHVIPKNNILCQILPDFKFTQSLRSNQNFMTTVGKRIIKIMEKSPKGCIIFVQSYEYLNQLMMFWERTDKINGIYSQLNSLKRIFKENDSTKKNVFEEYCAMIQVKKQDSVLFAVFGGKLSEGINFDDDLARTIICLGLPYPNIFTYEMELMKKKLGTKFNDYIDNIVMRQVNQAIGRSIRHINDYAHIVLFDSRYNNSNIKSKVSKWVRDSIIEDQNFGNMLKNIENFYIDKEN
ncbi:uncharacterized protein HGUI_00971 [Hanseniaspora guilliermondii]|uniref:ATP-dependent DNA helicase CHL1 n=1 Tax=Hanseniaspora guilliermondii TaxID=56406 RepID=A0A1L0B1C6_9ASCO|nr:uncharacterized protein HGUI_00971 [Hanseniaspora guilliermondii]